MKALLIIVATASAAFADATYQIDPGSGIAGPPGEKSMRCDAATKDSLATLVQAVSHIRIAKDGVYYRLVGDNDFKKATRSADNYGFVDSEKQTIVLAVLKVSVMDKPHAGDNRSKVMIGVIKRNKRPCSERWFGFGKAV